MAEKCVEKVEDMLTCSMCLEVLVDPQTFNCLHSYCKGCTERLQLIKQNGVEGFECPECRRFTPKAEVRVVHLIVQLLDAYHAAQNVAKDAKCEKCLRETAKWRCLDCKKFASLCDTCKSHHDEFAQGFGTEHQVISVEELSDSHPVIDKPLFCEDHKDYKLDVFCKQCERIMCVMCKMFHHEGHQAEPVADALKRILPECKAKQEEIEAHIKESAIAIESMKNGKQEVIQSSKDTKAQLKKELEEEIAKLKIAYNQKIKELDADESAQLSELDSEIKKAEDKVTEKNQVLNWMKATLVRSAGATLLQVLQGGLLEKLEQITTEGAICGGALTVKTHASRCWPWKIADIKGKPVEKQTIALPNATGDCPYTRIAILWETLWLFNHNTNELVQYKFDGTHFSTTPLNTKITTPRTALQYSNNDAVIAAKSGLYSVDKSCKVTNFFMVSGDFSDLCIAEDGKLYALEHSKGRVFVFRQQGHGWQKERDIALKLLKKYATSPYTYVNSLAVKNETIYVAMISQYYVVAYGMNGQMLKKYTGFDHTSVCGVDSAGHVLICDLSYCSLKRQRFDGECSTVSTLNCYPWFAVFQNKETLWVADSGNQLRKFVYE